MERALSLLTYWREWTPERNTWRDIVVRHERYRDVDLAIRAAGRLAPKNAAEGVIEKNGIT